MRVILALLAMLGATPYAWADAIAPEVFDAIPKADVVVLGEVHDNPLHHMNQARAVFSLTPRAVVWEMLSAEAAQRVPADLGDARKVARALDWDESGWPDFSMYYPVFVAARDARHYGAEVPNTLARRAVSEGALAVMPAGARFGLDADLPAEEQAAREAEQMEVHCNALPPKLLPGMVQAQRLRDAYLAQAVERALQEVGPPVAVITGSGHARKDWGVPAILSASLPEVSVLSVGQMENEAPEDPPFDLWIVTEAAPREDPCLGFR